MDAGMCKKFAHETNNTGNGVIRMATELTTLEWQQLFKCMRAGLPVPAELEAKLAQRKREQAQAQARAVPYDPEEQLATCSKLLVDAEERGHERLKQMMVRKVVELKRQTGRPLSKDERRLLGRIEYSAREIRYLGQYTGGK
jgi:hypothetical protein